MDIQKHQRTAQIMKLSSNLSRALSGLGYLLWLMWPLLLVALFTGAKFTMLGRDPMPGDEGNQLLSVLRIVVVGGACVALFIAQQLVRRLRDLMNHFRAGDIFNQQTIDAARRALFHTATLFGLYLAGSAFGQFYRAVGASAPRITVDISMLVYGLVFFGVMYVLLWTLEIGRDLREESELTV